MAEIKNSRKKLTEAGGAVCVLTFVAMCLSVIGVLTEYIGVNLHNEYFTGRVENIFAKDYSSFVSIYEKPIILSVFTLVLFVIFFSARRKKKIGGEMSALLIIMSCVFAVKPIFAIADIIETDEFAQTIKYGSDADTLNEVLNLSISLSSLVACFLLLIAGLVLLGRLASEEFTVEIPTVKKVALVEEKPVEVKAESNGPVFEYGNTNYIKPDVADSYKKDEGAQPVIAPISDSSESEKPVESILPGMVLATEKDGEEAEKNSEFIVCPNCQSQFPAGVKFCAKCGKKFE